MPDDGGSKAPKLLAALCGAGCLFMGLSSILTVAMAMNNEWEEGNCAITQHSCQRVCVANDFCDFKLQITGAKFTGERFHDKDCTTRLMSSTKHPTEERCNEVGQERQNTEFKCTFFPVLASKREWCQLGQGESDIGAINVMALLASFVPLLCGVLLCGWAAKHLMQKPDRGDEPLRAVAE
mmetsp:Transcript_122875/g.358629  ORF Transcript_122875/g.358629 Transcript_122875/m.358629 type:complete len:181 (-) Transcript_122875:155-697(-)